MSTADPALTTDWARWRAEWDVLPGVGYFNHGSFGPSPRSVIHARNEWYQRLESQPCQLLVRDLPELFHNTYQRLAEFLNCAANDLLFVENATAGMNIAAESVPLGPGDEVLVNDHEYGAAIRIWERACQRAGARIVTQSLDLPPDDPEDWAQQVVSELGPRTKVLLVSHVTSCTGLIFPLARVCELARAAGVTVVVDGPHALAQVPVDLNALGADFYAASCHKWLCAPIGSGFLYVADHWKHRLSPPMLSWGRPARGHEPSWRDEFGWQGTRDPSAYLAIVAALDFFEPLGWERLRERLHELSRLARQAIDAETGLRSICPDDPRWYGSMVTFHLPPGVDERLGQRLWEQHRQEVLITHWRDQPLLRVSCHLYHQPKDFARLASAIAQVLGSWAR